MHRKLALTLCLSTLSSLSAAQSFNGVSAANVKFTQQKALKYAKSACLRDYMVMSDPTTKTPKDMAKTLASELKAVGIANGSAAAKKYSGTDGKTMFWVIYPSASRGFKYGELGKDGLTTYFCTIK